MHQLSIDIGNTLTKIGVFEHRVLVDKFIFKSEDVDFIVNEILNFTGCQIIFSSVKTLNEKYSELAASFSVFIVLNHLTPLPIQLDYNTPQTLGRDRIAGVMGAFRMLPNQNVLIVDAGTCITLDVLTKNCVYIGGNIAPGIIMRQRAMNHFTASLPLVNIAWNPKMLGKTTEQALQNGSLKGVVYEIIGFIDALGLEINNFGVIFTGGDAELLSKHIKREIIVNNDLVLLGLNEILNFNVS